MTSTTSATINGSTETFADVTEIDSETISDIDTLNFRNENADESGIADYSVIGADAEFKGGHSYVADINYQGGLANEGLISEVAYQKYSYELTISGYALATSTSATVAPTFYNTGSIVSGLDDVIRFTSNPSTDIDGMPIANTNPGSVVNGGSMDADSGFLWFSMAVTTAPGQKGYINLTNAGAARFESSVDSGQTISFTKFDTDTHEGSEGIEINELPAFQASVQDYGSNTTDYLRLDDLTNLELNYANGTLGVSGTIAGTANTEVGTIALPLSGAVSTIVNTVGDDTYISAVQANNTQSYAFGILRSDGSISPFSDASGTLVENVSANNVVQTVINANTLQFIDGNTYFGSDTNGGDAAMLYAAMLGRAADPSGLGYLTNIVATGSVEIAAQTIAATPEFATGENLQDNAAYVSTLYQNLLGRSADAAGQAFWQEQLDSNTLSKAQLAAAFILSPEVQAYQQSEPLALANLTSGVFAANPAAVEVVAAYQTIFGRAPDHAGLIFWTQSVQAGTTEQTLLADFIASPEFEQGQSNAEFVSKIQTNADGGVDQGGLKYWQNLLDAGAVTRTEVAEAYANSSLLAQRTAPDITATGIALVS